MTTTAEGIVFKHTLVESHDDVIIEKIIDTEISIPLAPGQDNNIA